MITTLIFYLVSVLFFLVMFYLVCSVWFRGKRSAYLKLFFIMGLMLSFWTLTNGINVLVDEQTYEYVYPVSMLVMCSLGPVLLWYMLYFTESKLASSKIVAYVLISLGSVIIYRLH